MSTLLLVLKAVCNENHGERKDASLHTLGIVTLLFGLNVKNALTKQTLLVDEPEFLTDHASNQLVIHLARALGGGAPQSPGHTHH